MFAGLPVAAPTTCEDITVPMCQIGIDYTQTAMPNYWNMVTQEEAERELQQFYPLVNRLSSVTLRSFLCAVYLPRYFLSINKIKLFKYTFTILTILQLMDYATQNLNLKRF